MKEEDYYRARKRVEGLRDFYEHVIEYIAVNVSLAVVNFFATPGFWWFLFITFFWGIRLVAHGLSVFLE